jgi:FMN-dependent oxidoreductase (nitrilotriacetate monooxygenase family)
MVRPDRLRPTQPERALTVNATPPSADDARRVLLSAFVMTSVTHQSAGLWVDPTNETHRYTDLDHWTSLARLLESAGFENLFIADFLAVHDTHEGSIAPALRHAAQMPINDPLMAVSAMAAVTKRLGFGITVSTTFEQPYPLARRLTTLDHLTKGRLGWNVVTSMQESTARNHGQDTLLEHDERYERAEEFMEVVYKLWEGSWEDDAVVRDRETGVYTDPDKVHPIEHEGRWYRVPGAFTSEPSPQRTPFLFQAGTSPRGRAFAARHAEAVFMTPQNPVVARAYVDDIRHRAAAEGRDPRSIKIFTAFVPVLGETDEAARAEHDRLVALGSRETAATLYSSWTGIDTSQIDPDQPLADLETNTGRSFVEMFSRLDPTRVWRVRDIYDFIIVGGLSPVVVGSPATVADEMERWVREADVDGFNVGYALNPGTFEDVARLLVPELRRRGLVPDQDDAPAATLRERLSGRGPRLHPDHPGSTYRRVPSPTTSAPDPDDHA